MSRPDLTTRMAQGAAAGLLATVALHAVRTASQKQLPATMAPIRQDPGEFMVQRAEALLPDELRERVPEAAETAAARGLAMGYGATSGALYAALRPAGRSTVIEGLPLGLAVWAAGYLGWLPAAGLLPPLTEQAPAEVFGPVVRHALWGAFAVAAYDRIDQWAR